MRAYLELMQMRMPDRLAFTIDIEPSLRTLPFPPMALLTLVENAIRHGIDPASDGGASRSARAASAGRAASALWVADTGVGLTEGAGTGTGLRQPARAPARPSSARPAPSVDAAPGRRRTALRADVRVDARRATHERADRADRRRRAAAARAAAPPTWRASGPSCRSSPRRATAARRSRCSTSMRPQVVFLDVHMPGMNGVEAARAIGRRAEVVFVTAFDQYAVEAFGRARSTTSSSRSRPSRLARLGAAAAGAPARRRRRAPARTSMRCSTAWRERAAPARRRRAQVPAVDQGLGRQRPCA